MRVLITVSNWLGHYCSLVPTAWALQAAGHDVRVACAADQQEMIMRAGLIPAPVLEAVDMAVLARFSTLREAVTGAKPPAAPVLHPLTGQELTDLSEIDFEELRVQMIRDVRRTHERSHHNAVALARDWRPDLVLHEFFSTEGPLAAAVTGVPAILHLWGPFGSAETEPGFQVRPSDPDPFGMFRRYGAPSPGPESVRYVIDPCAASMAPPIGDARRLDVRYVPYNGSSPVGPTWRTVGRRRICVLWGTSVTQIYGVRNSPLPSLLEALHGIDAEIIMTTGKDTFTKFDRWPPGIEVRDTYPLRLLLEGADVLVHHGSANSAMTAAACGVPQLALPISEEQKANMARFEATGGAISLPGPERSGAHIAEALERLLSADTYATAATALAKEMNDRPTPAELVARLEEIAGGTA